MKIEYIGHASLLVDTDDQRILTDPWWAGPAYCDGWFVFPKPVSVPATPVDTVLISHGHEDHLHAPTLRALPKRSTRAFYPCNWYGGASGFLGKLGFSRVTEARHFKTYAVAPRTSITYLVNNLDSLIVVEGEHGGRPYVLVDVNDALHAYPDRVIRAFASRIRERWPRVDAVFCGFGGASYFPNMIQAPGKDDTEIARLREQMFVHNFCKIVGLLEPAVAVPFAADFVLLRDRERWINDTRFPRSRMADYCAEHFPETALRTRILDMYPGDSLDGVELVAASPYRAQLRNGRLDHLVESQYAEELRRVNAPRTIGQAEADRLCARLAVHLERRLHVIASDLIRDTSFAVRVTDFPGDQVLNITVHRKRPTLERAAAPSSANELTVETTSEVLRHSLASEWGGDAIVIGYGARFSAASLAQVESRLDTFCAQLLTRLPRASKHWRKEPLRLARHVIGEKVKMLRRIPPSPAVFKATPDGALYGKHWLARSKCEICRICDLPLLRSDERDGAGGS